MEIQEQTFESSGVKHLTAPEKLLYWITERNQIRLKKDLGLPKPWSNDETFQRTYFCNVRREHDKVTQWLRSYYAPYVYDEAWFLYNIIFSRFINWPSTLDRIGYLSGHDPDLLDSRLARLAKDGKLWGGAYIITTHGISMGKTPYLAHNVLGAVNRNRSLLGSLCGGTLGVGKGGQLATAHRALQTVEGMGSFLAAQVVADLKNTPGHPLAFADDWMTFVAHGPGSLRGLSWFWSTDNERTVAITPTNFQRYFTAMREYVDENWNETLMGKPICNQDLQNCLCEMDKYMRVSTGVGRSKRNYNGYV